MARSARRWLLGLLAFLVLGFLRVLRSARVPFSLLRFALAYFPRLVPGRRVLIITQGVPGIGKTVTGELASDLLGASATLEQDTFYHLGKKAKAKCMEVCEGHFRDPRLRYVWLLRNNSQLGQYSQFLALARQHAWRTLVLVPRELAPGAPAADRERIRAVCEEAVTVRTGHLSFDDLEVPKRVGIVKNFWEHFTPATRSATGCDFIASVAYLQPLELSAEGSEEAEAPPEQGCSALRREKDAVARDMARLALRAGSAPEEQPEFDGYPQN